MMSLGNNNLIYMMVPSDSSMSQSTSDAHAQGQFPTYTVASSPHARVTQMMTNVTKTNLMSDIDDPIKSAKTSIISIVKGGNSSNQQIFVRKNNDSQEVSEIKIPNVSSDGQIVLTRNPGGDSQNMFVRKGSASQELMSEPQNRHPDGHVIHHGRTSMAENKSMSNQISYQDASLYGDISYPSFQIKSPTFEIHEPMRTPQKQADGKNQTVHEPSSPYHQHGEPNNQQLQEHQQVDQNSHQRMEVRTLHHQNEVKMQVIGSPRPSDQQRESKTTPDGRTLPQQDQKVQHESPRTYYDLTDHKLHQKHEPARMLQKGQRDPSRHLYHIGDQKNVQMHEINRSLYSHENSKQSHEAVMYQLSDGKLLHESSRPLRHLVDQKEQEMHESVRYQHESKARHDANRPAHQQYQQSVNQKSHESAQQMHQMSEQKMHDNSRMRQHGDQKGQQIHVHKVHHGNARVKYVEFKPIQENVKYRQMLHHPAHSYNPNMKPAMHYTNHLANPNAQHLTVQTPSHSPMSPLHSPPALRPPPTIPSGTVWHSPPSLVPSPEVRPRFDFISSPPPVTTAGSPCPVPVANMIQHKHYKGGKQNIQGNHNILLPRIPANYQLGPSNEKMLARSKAAFVQSPCSHSPANSPLYAHHNFSQAAFPASSVTTTVTVTMTYIPIATSTKDKFVYVPVNSGQPMVLYQNQQQAGGKPAVILPQQVIQGSKSGKSARNAKEIKESSAYTTVRLQGLVNCGIPKSSQFPHSQNSPMKNFTYHFTNPAMSPSQGKSPGFIKLDKKSSFNLDMIDLESEKSNLTAISSKDIVIRRDPNETLPSVTTAAKMDIQRDVMTNNQSQIVSTLSGDTQPAHAGMKRTNIGIPTPADTKVVTQSSQSPCISSQEKRSDDDVIVSNAEASVSAENDAKDKKRRGRPPFEKISKKVRKEKKSKGSKLLSMQDNVLTALTGDLKSSTNQLLIEAYKKQQQLLFQKHYFEDPLLRLPELPPTPDKWSCDDVHKYLQSTDCACYADALKTEEIDGRSFLLLTRESLMEFVGIKLGPALKLAGHAASLRARQRIYCLSQEQYLSKPSSAKEKKTSQHLSKDQANHPPKDKKPRLSSSSISSPSLNKQPSKSNEQAGSVNSEDAAKPLTGENVINVEPTQQEKLIPPTSTSTIEIIEDVFEPGPVACEQTTSTMNSQESSTGSLVPRHINRDHEIVEVNGQAVKHLKSVDNSDLPKEVVRNGDSISKSMDKIPVDMSDISSTASFVPRKVLSPFPPPLTIAEEKGISPLPRPHTVVEGKVLSPLARPHTVAEGKALSPLARPHTVGEGKAVSPLPLRPAIAEGKALSQLPPPQTIAEGKPLSPLPMRHTITEGRVLSPLPIRHTITDGKPVSPLPMRHTITEGIALSPLPPPHAITEGKSLSPLPLRHTIVEGKTLSPLPASYTITDGKSVSPLPLRHTIVDGNSLSPLPPPQTITEGKSLSPLPLRHTIVEGNSLSPLPPPHTITEGKALSPLPAPHITTDIESDITKDSS